MFVLEIIIIIITVLVIISACTYIIIDVNQDDIFLSALVVSSN